MRETLTEEKIIYYIAKDPDVLERAYFSSMRDLCRRYVQISSDTLERNRLQNEIILANSIPGKSEGEIQTGGGYHNPDRIFQVLERTEKDCEDYKAGLYTLMEEASDKLENIRRFQVVFSKIPGEWRETLKRLYHDKDKWRVVVNESGMSNSSFAAKRAAVIDDLCRLHNSTLTTGELAKFRPVQMNVKGKKKAEMNGQMQLQNLRK